MALQPFMLVRFVNFNLQQQKLLWLYSPFWQCATSFLIYNSRNCYGFIAQWRRIMKRNLSTIVEIVMALQPICQTHRCSHHLQQQKLLWLYSHLLRCKYMTIISISRTFILCFWRKNYTPVLHEINECVANLKKYSCLWIVARWYRNKGLSAQKQTTAWS